MLRSLQANARSPRKLLLFACGCCRHTWHLLIDPATRQAVEICEGYADGQAPEDKFSRVALNAIEAADRMTADQASRASRAVAYMAESLASLPLMLNTRSRLTPAERLAQQWQDAEAAVFFARQVWSAANWSASTAQLTAETAALCDLL